MLIVPSLRRVMSCLVLVAAVGGAGACGARGDPSTDVVRNAALADTLSALIADAYDFSRPDVVQRLMALYPTTDPIVSAAAGRVSLTRAALQGSIVQFWQRVGQNMVGPKFVIGSKRATALGPSAAVLTLTYSIPHKTPEGLAHTLSGAWTAVFVRRAGRWVIVQEHLSDPPVAPATTTPTTMTMPMP